MTPAIVTSRTRTHLTVECDSCGWVCTVGSYDAIRMAGRRHAEREGHRVVGFSERATYWDGTPAVVAFAERAGRPRPVTPVPPHHAAE